MERTNQIIILKPDAMKSSIDGNVVKALFFAFANHLSQHEVHKLSDDMAIIANRAEQQAYERSLTEPAFQGDLRAVDDSVINALIEQANIVYVNAVSVLKTITLGIRTIGCDILAERQYQLRSADVNEIYFLKNSDGRLADLSKRLHDYLDNQMVMLLECVVIT